MLRSLLHTVYMKQRAALGAGLAAAAMAAILFVPQGRTFAHRALTAAGISTQPQPVRPGDRMRPLRLTAVDGSSMTFDPQSLQGTTVFNVFTSWCPSCRAEAPDIADAAREFSSRGVRFVGIDQAEPLSVAARLRDAEGLPFPVFVDESALSKTVLGARMIPTTVVVKNGVVTGVAYGPLTRNQLSTLVHTAL